MSFVSNICFFLYFTIVLLVVLSLNIAELVISQKYIDPHSNDCHNDHLFSPVVWLKVDGIIGFIEMGLLVILTLWYWYAKWRRSIHRRRQLFQPPREVEDLPPQPSLTQQIEHIVMVAGQRQQELAVRYDRQRDEIQAEYDTLRDMSPMICLLVLCAVMQMVWVIVGTVILWRDNDPKCQPRELHDVLWSAVIIHLAFIFRVGFLTVM
jgi:hypothetical protein